MSSPILLPRVVHVMTDNTGRKIKEIVDTNIIGTPKNIPIGMTLVFNGNRRFNNKPPCIHRRDNDGLDRALVVTSFYTKRQ